MTIVSRGGTQDWTRGLAAGYADIFKLTAPEKLGESGEPTKTTSISAADREIVRLVAKRDQLERPALLHPSIFYRTYLRIRRDDPYGFVRLLSPSERGAKGLVSSYRPLPSPKLKLGLELPERYVAVRFYTRPSFPNTVQTRRLVERVIAGLTERMPVVLLHHGLDLDEHREFKIKDADVIRIPPRLTARQNLRFQSAVIAGADAFVGTYGGFAYLAPMYGVPAATFNALPEHTLPWHLALAQKVFSSPRFASLLVLEPSQLELVDLVSDPELRG
jgi:hypothetical protein